MCPWKQAAAHFKFLRYLLNFVPLAVSLGAIAQDPGDPLPTQPRVRSDATAIQYIVGLPREQATRFLADNAVGFLADRSAWKNYTYFAIESNVGGRVSGFSSLNLRPFVASRHILCRESRKLFPQLSENPQSLSHEQTEALREHLASAEVWSDSGPLQFFYTPRIDREETDDEEALKQVFDRMKKDFNIIIHQSPTFELPPVGGSEETIEPRLDLERILDGLDQNPVLIWTRSPAPTERIRPIECNSPPNDPGWDLQLYLRRYDMCSVWDRPLASPHEVLVGLIDSGMRLSHEEFRDRIAFPVDVFIDDRYGDVYADSDPATDDHKGHGTRTAGIIAANADNLTGISGFVRNAPVKIIPINTQFYSAAGNPIGHYDHWIDGMYWAIEHGAEVICLNLKGVFLPRDRDYSVAGSMAKYYYAEEKVAQYSIDRDVIVCAAAGSDGISLKNPEFPTAVSSYICVTGIDDFGALQGGCNYGERVDVGAFANEISTTGSASDDEYDTSFNSTSAATPQVAALCALLKVHYGDRLGADDIRRLVKDNVRRTPDSSGIKSTVRWRYGLIDPPSVFDAADELLNRGE